jgi:transcriptional regulator GlxA family with amidase domain
MERPAEGTSSHPQRARGFPPEAYDQLIKFATEYGNACGFSSSAQRAERAAEITYLVNRLSKGDVRLRLRTLARTLGVEPKVLGDGFPKLYHTTPKTYQIRVRIEWACNAISMQTARKLESIAAETGYSDVADFNHFLRKHIGMSPRQYQQQCLKHEAQFNK